MFVVETFQNEKDKEFVKVFNGTFCVSFKTNSLKRRPFYINFTLVKCKISCFWVANGSTNNLAMIWKFTFVFSKVNLNKIKMFFICTLYLLKVMGPWNKRMCVILRLVDSIYSHTTLRFLISWNETEVKFRAVLACWICNVRIEIQMFSKSSFGDNI